MMVQTDDCMSQSGTDVWAKWLLHRRHGGDSEHLEAVLARLYPVRDKVLANARLPDGGTLLDVGCGDGLIAFGALQRSASSRVIFADVSQDLLDHASALAREMGVADRCAFRCAPAEDLSALSDANVDAVTTRSVLVYIADKQRAFDEFYRVLKPEGRLSLFEPINRFNIAESAHVFWGMDATPVMAVAAKLKAVYERLQPPATDPALNFDERDLVACAERAGFREVHLDLEIRVRPLGHLEHKTRTWDSFITMAPHPKVPTLREAMAQALSEEEAARFTAHMRPLIEAYAGTVRTAVAYLAARK